MRTIFRYNYTRKLCLFIVSLLVTFYAFSSETDIQSLKKELQSAKGSDRINTLVQLSKEYRFVSFIVSEKYLSEAYSEAILQKDSSQLVSILRQIGGVKEYKSEHDSALYYFQKSATIAKTIGDTYEATLSRLNLAVSYVNKGEFQQAINIYKENISVFIDRKDTAIIAQIYNNLGTFYMRADQFDSASVYLQKAIEKKKSLGDSIAYAISVSNLADLYWSINDFEKAEKAHKKALAIFERHNSTYNVAFSVIQLSKTYEKLGKTRLAELHLYKAVNLAEMVGSIKLRSKSYLELFEIFKERGNSSDALKYLEKHIELKDSINTIKQSELLNELAIAFDVEEKENQLIHLNFEIEQKKKNETIFLIFIIFTIAIALITTFAAVKFRKKNKQLIKQGFKEIEKDRQKVIISELDENEKQLLQKITNLLENEKVFLDNTLSIASFSEMLDSNINYVSKSINAGYQKNFNALINEYRVKEAKLLLADNKAKNYTLAAISEMCGFTSISVFNRSFKKETGVTPSAFLKELGNLL